MSVLSKSMSDNIALDGQLQQDEFVDAPIVPFMDRLLQVSCDGPQYAAFCAAKQA